MKTITYLDHGRVQLALHTLQKAEGPALLLLHALGEASPPSLPASLQHWQGSVYALDFTGHGQSMHTKGGGYSCEILMADVDTVLQHIGSCYVLGQGLGAYIALLIAGARANLIKGIILEAGTGLDGGDSRDTKQVLTLDTARTQAKQPTDPYALIELNADIRLPHYAERFARLACQAPAIPNPIRLACSSELTPWLQAISKIQGVTACSLEQAIKEFQGQ